MTITLAEAIKAVKEQNLTKSDLEHYHNEMSLLLTQMYEEAADLEKEEAMFMDKKDASGNRETVALKKVMWKATQAGQRLIVLKRYISAVKTLLGSIKNRLYLVY